MKWSLSIDPGKSTGWALWRSTTDVPTHTGVLHARGDDFEWVRNAVGMFQDFWRRDLKGIEIHAATIEAITFWGVSGRSIASAARGDSINTAYLIGAMYHFLTERGCKVDLVDVRKWKGQMTDQAVEAMIKRVIGTGEFKQHAREAVGIGLWARGLF